MIKSTVIWTLCAARLPTAAAQYLVSDALGQERGVARYFPRLHVWRWPNANSKRFEIAMWAPIPAPQVVPHG